MFMRSTKAEFSRILSLFLCLSCWTAFPATNTGMRLTMVTQWAVAVSPTNAHSDYPRPTMMRTDWQSLNGLWDFGVARLTNAPDFSGQILVPFPIQSFLSAANRSVVNERRILWYRRQFSVPNDWQGRRILLHFEASDWETHVWVNGKKQGTHKGGYDRFSFDITEAIKPGEQQELMVSVFDPTDSGYQPRGKQVQRPQQPFCSPCSGIWQTVWIEPVAETSIDSLRLTPDIDSGILKIKVHGRGSTNRVVVEVVATAGEVEVGRAHGELNREFRLPVPNTRVWSPDDPFLYDLKVSLVLDGTKGDSVTSYFGMRKISIGTNEGAFPTLMLNNQRHFQLGPLDQGYWPDGIYTAPTDDALRHDIELMKQLGFNMCRKHVKIEPERWYYWCDKVGLLVWQDMPNANRPVPYLDKEAKIQKAFAQQFENELVEMLEGRGNHPSIIVWVLFNQGWGQYDTKRITTLCKEMDPSRLVVSASGWHDIGTGDLLSIHNYPVPSGVKGDGRRASVVGECGGLSLVVPGHVWGAIGDWNTTYFKDAQGLLNGYEGLIKQLIILRERDGVSAAVITQLTDVENELDGFVTYDRSAMKLPVEKVRAINSRFTFGTELTSPESR
jgi:hypothetical protein